MPGLDVDRTSAEEIARLLDERTLSCEEVASGLPDAAWMRSTTT